MRPALATHVVFAVLLWPVAALALYAEASGLARALTVVGVLAVHYYIFSTRVSVGGEKLTYQTLWTRNAVALSSIKSSALVYVTQRAGRYGTVEVPYLVVTSQRGAQLRVRIKPFAANDLRQFFTISELRLSRVAPEKLAFLLPPEEQGMFERRD